ncbi:P-loop containing nucleoside triphosphate hydrolase protein [Artomyces pyxidatus]|uniref:P-loop containing nucleoside triphosphate hydrolase protein n=1 Tax=Artomyces pyxidatus TaxID=48021 RepID=A0ACB8T5N8_9AGAM|nr:P-loop containing nucleoside triphosphate hydrolase protein [Artomyces pyxidatus]
MRFGIARDRARITRTFRARRGGALPLSLAHLFLSNPVLLLPTLAAQFWADVRLVFGNAGRSLVGPGPRCPRAVATQAPSNLDAGIAHWRPYATSASNPCHYFRSIHQQSSQLPLAPRREQSSSAGTSAALLEQSEDSPRFDWRLKATSRRTAPHHLRPVYKRRVEPQHKPLQPGDAFYDAVEAYQERFLPLMDAEQAEEDAALRERLSKWSLERLKSEGYCITGMSAFWLDATQYGLPIASFTLGPGIVLPENKFEGGTQVLVTHLDPLVEKPVKGHVVSSSSTHLRVAFQQLFQLEQGPWRLDLGQSNIAYERMRAAIRQLNQDPKELEENPPEPDREFILQGTLLRDVLLRSFSPALAHTPTQIQAPDDTEYVAHETLEHPSRESGDHGGAFKEDMMIQSWARRHMRHNPVKVEGDPILSNLNPTQVRAVAMMLGERVSLVQGPPGTGKTKTIIEACRLLKVHFEVSAPILVCTYTNVAVDNVVEGLVAAGVKPLRVGYDGKVQASLYEYTLEAALERHPSRPTLEQLMKDEERIRKLQMNDNSNASSRLRRYEETSVSLERQINAVRNKLFRLRQVMVFDVLQGAEVICTTCISSAAAPLRMVDFPVVFLDEASMSTEPASLIPLMKGSRHVTLIGDHKQLPPVIKTEEAQSQGLGISLFERLTEEGVVPSIMLDLQYRMHPSISRFPSSEFYNRSLLDGTIDAHGNVPSRLHPPISSHLVEHPETGHRPSVVFLDHTGSESPKNRSKVNWTDAHIVCNVIEDLLLSNENLRGEDIGVIAPYVAQIALLSNLLTADKKYQERFTASLGTHRAMQLAQIEVKTVNGFEGREKDVIIFSTVRNNSAGYIGFLADRRRLNVGLTRAKRGLFVVGGLSTLRAGKGGARGAGATAGKGAEAWKRYVEYLTEGGLVRSWHGHGSRLRTGTGLALPQGQLQVPIAS